MIKKSGTLESQERWTAWIYLVLEKNIITNTKGTWRRRSMLTGRTVIVLSINSCANTLCTLSNRCSLACGSNRSWRNWCQFFVKVALDTPLFCFIRTCLQNSATVTLKQFPEALTRGHPLLLLLLRSNALGRSLRIMWRCTLSTRVCDGVGVYDTQDQLLVYRWILNDALSIFLMHYRNEGVHMHIF